MGQGKSDGFGGEAAKSITPPPWQNVVIPSEAHEVCEVEESACYSFFRIICVFAV